MNDTHSPLAGPQRAPLSDTQYVVLPLLALALVVALRPSWPVRIGGVVLHVLWTLNATKYSAGGGYEDYLKGSFLGCASLMALYNLVLTDPMMEWRNKSRPDTRPIDLPLWERVYWVFCAACNNRGLGWSFEVPYIPPLPSYQRWPFLKRRSRQLVWNLFLVDVAQTYQRMNPVFSLGNTTSMWSQGVAFGYLNLLARLIMAWGIFNIPYCWLSLAYVAIGIHKPKDWPDTFGNWNDAYTVRRFWSRSWHQRLRRYTAATGKSAARLLRCKPGTWLSARVQLIFGFGISALAHLIGDLMVDPRYAGASVPFFLWQVVAITFEDFIIDVGRHYGVVESLWIHIVGWVWTAGWFLTMTTKFVEWTFPAGAGMHETMKFSAVRPLLDFGGQVTGVDIVQYLTSLIPGA